MGSENLEKFLFKKLEVWAVLLLAVLAIIVAIIFASIVRNEALGYGKFGALGKASLLVAEIPSTARQVFATDRSMVAVNGNERSVTQNKTGWTLMESGLQDFPGLLLMSRYDGDRARHVVELVDVRQGSVIHSWSPDADQLLDRASRESNIISFERWDTKHFRYIHPLLMDDGGLILKDHQSPLMRVDACENLVWRQEGSFFHHTTETGSDGTIWVPGRSEPSVNKLVPKEFRDDSIVQISSDGDILYQKSIQEIFIENGLKLHLYASGTYQDDRLHANDVQPVVGDGPFWKSGDLFLSLRHLSMVLLYRPSTNEIIWKKRGPWAAQHDVDIVDDHTIAVFNNNTFRYSSKGEGKVDGVNEIVFYDFETDTVSRPYDNLFKTHKIATRSEGLFSILPSGYLLVEEENNGRLLIFSPKGELAAEFVNRAVDGDIYHLGWSRLISRDLSATALAGIGNADCGQ